MIPIYRVDLDTDFSKRLDKKTTDLEKKLDILTAGKERTDKARADWKNAAALRRGILKLLFEMASGVERCMYCGDGQGTDVDHFKPIAEDPYGEAEPVGSVAYRPDDRRSA